MKTYMTKSGVQQYKPSLKQLTRSIESDSNEGYCLACAEKAYGVEPDARKYNCESCNMPKVYGAEELLMMGLYY